jgi:YggT family protein
MIANADNALLFLVTSLLDLVMSLFLLRLLLQLVRADFYSPISQMVWKLSQPVCGPLARLLPRWRRLDLGAALVLLLLAMLYIQMVAAILPVPVGALETLLLALLKLASLTCYIYTLSLFAMALLSWVGPGVSNPAANVLWSLNEPLLRPVRRVLPPVSGLDLSPLVVMLVLMFVNRLLPLGVFQ